jgi:hypothetical protein
VETPGGRCPALLQILEGSSKSIPPYENRLNFLYSSWHAVFQTSDRLLSNFEITSAVGLYRKDKHLIFNRLSPLDLVSSPKTPGLQTTDNLFSG